ncbi:methyltransferase domain-containing protein [Candidatus Nomurabacteria bacterium]|uniref:Methyltransferase domain-containing protein n=1 Tax=candidate division WWE3 bacterium TaxID=2053526 RepID=A0A955E0R1_UNCKA|nr:methyltransferase domain-containing protein [candidate division WWE3 bacterium]MCB9823398.1 methyltransferase domain-containing protein [Candidatus Nomurabacteria bacterium]MCB9827680.1 methyltransferase domain-containing protein [Candidatus Nomurabacteria bacterium]
MTVINSRWSKEPNKLLVKYLADLKTGKVLDLGGSDGTNAIFLARNGFEVMNIDKDNAALNDLKIFANENNLNIHTEGADLNNYIINDTYDDIISFFTFHFLKLSSGDKLIDSIQEHTATDGINIIVGFTDQGEFNINHKKCYFVGDYLVNKYKSWDVLLHDKVIGGTKSGMNQEREILVARRR